MPVEEVKQKTAYSKELENYLKSNEIPYDVIRCNSCGGKIKKIEFPILEVVP